MITELVLPNMMRDKELVLESIRALFFVISLTMHLVGGIVNCQVETINEAFLLGPSRNFNIRLHSITVIFTHPKKASNGTDS